LHPYCCFNSGCPSQVMCRQLWFHCANIFLCFHLHRRKCIPGSWKIFISKNFFVNADWESLKDVCLLIAVKQQIKWILILYFYNPLILSCFQPENYEKNIFDTFTTGANFRLITIRSSIYKSWSAINIIYIKIIDKIRYPVVELKLHINFIIITFL